MAGLIRRRVGIEYLYRGHRGLGIELSVDRVWRPETEDAIKQIHLRLGVSGPLEKALNLMVNVAVFAAKDV